MKTPLGPTRSVLIEGVSLFQRLFYTCICKIHVYVRDPTQHLHYTIDVIISGMSSGRAPL